jgi:hypothetical protein
MAWVSAAAWAGWLVAGAAGVAAALVVLVLGAACAVHLYYLWVCALSPWRGSPVRAASCADRPTCCSLPQRFGAVNRLPGRLMLPVLGNVWDFGDPSEYETKFMEEVARMGSKGAFRTWLGVFPVVEVFEPDLIQDVMGTHPHRHAHGHTHGQAGRQGRWVAVGMVRTGKQAGGGASAYVNLLTAVLGWGGGVCAQGRRGIWRRLACTACWCLGWAQAC